MKKAVALIASIFLVVQVLIYLFSEYLLRYKIEQIYEKESSIISAQYNSIMSGYTKLANLLFKESINKKNVIDIFKKAHTTKDEKELREIRNTLFMELESTYNELKVLNLRQLHFHLLDNTSFLRFHRPHLFGDDLTNVRYSIKATNETQKYHEGFEEGRIYNGFRYVFPMFDENGIHIGSVETSLSYMAIKSDIEKLSNIHVHFLIDKETVIQKVWNVGDAYKESSISDSYLYEKSQDEDKESTIPNETVETIDQNLKNIVDARIQHFEKFAVHTFVGNAAYLVTLMPVANVEGKKGIAYFITYQEYPIISHIYKTNRVGFLLVSFLNGVIFYFIYLSRKSNSLLRAQKKKLEEKNEEIVKLYEKIIHEENIAKQALENENRANFEMLVQQSKMAAMGEMIGAIAHQWKQPLNAIALLAALTKEEVYDENTQEVITLQDKILVQINFMSKTITDFRDFFNPNKKVQDFFLDKAIEDILDMLRLQLSAKGIEVAINKEGEFLFNGVENEFKQCALNIINNAKDVLLTDKGNRHKKITVDFTKGENEIKICFKDNGGGIKEELLPEKIFDAYVTTKGDEGTGIGLHLVKKIIEENFSGKIFAYNDAQGAVFEIVLPLDRNKKVQSA